MEKGQWFPFKGLRERGETNTEAAIREIREETCDAVHVSNIELDCNYSTKRKYYHIGLHRITMREIIQFFQNRYSNVLEKHYLEKEDIKLFPIDTIEDINFHEITRIPIQFYYNVLLNLQNSIRSNLINRIRENMRIAYNNQQDNFHFQYHNKPTKKKSSRNSAHAQLK